MCALLSTDPAAALSVVNLLLRQCDEPRLAATLGVKRLKASHRVVGEGAYSGRGARPWRGPRGRRFDLLFDAGDRAVVVEVKLGASLGDLQLEDLLRADVEKLGLADGTRLGVVVLGPRELELGGVKDPDDRLLKRGAVRWSAVVEDMMVVSFDDDDAKQAWNELLGLYVRRGAIPVDRVRPPPRMALEALAGPLREHVQDLVGADRVRLDAGKGGNVTFGGRRTSWIEMVIDRRRPRRDQRIKILLRAPKGGRRTATISGSGAPGHVGPFAAPAALTALEVLLKQKLSEILGPPAVSAGRAAR